MPSARFEQVEADRVDAQGDFFRQINKAPFPESNKFPYFTGTSGRVHAMTADGKFLCNTRRDRFVAIAIPSRH